MAEVTFSDFSGGMNALAAVDKCDRKECLLAENVRLDETGNIQSSGAFTRQNTSAYAASGGTNTNNVHSLYWNPSLGAVAGVGQDVFQGTTLGGMASKLTGQNTRQQKMSFASAPNRVYFDVGSMGYWSDMNNLLLVDWPSPVAVGAIVSGPTTVGTGSNVNNPGQDPWSGPNNVTSTNSNVAATFTSTHIVSQPLNATMTTNSFSITSTAVTGIVVTVVAQVSSVAPTLDATLLKNGVPVGVTKALSVPGTVFSTMTFGNSNDLWGSTWAQADINSGSFGVQFQSGAGVGLVVTIYQAQITIYQGQGFVAAAGASGVPNGTYTWKVTFVAANGEESDGSNDSNSAVLVSQQGTLTAIQTGDARTVARNVYRKGGALTSHYLVGSIQDNVSTTYSDNQSDINALNAGIILAGDVPGDYPNSRLGSVNVRFPTLHYDRVFWIIPGTNKLVWSKPLNGFAYPSINFLNVGDSKPCSRAVSIFGELIIYKTDSIWRLTGTDESSFDLTETPSSVGTDESFTIAGGEEAGIPDKVLFHNRFGFWLFNGYTSQPVTTKLDLWTKQLDRTNKSLFGVNGFHPPEVVSPTVPLNFCAVGNTEKFYVSYAEAGQSQNNAVLVFDLKHGNITKRPTKALSLAIDPVNGYVYMGDSSGFVSLLDDWNGTNAGGMNLNFDYQYGYQDLERGSNKALWALEFYLNTNGQSLTPSVYYDNGLASETLPPITTTGLQRVVRTCEATQSRKMQNFSWRLNGSLSKVNSSGTPQIQIVHVKALYDVRVGRARTGQT